ncbi:MAG: ATP-binding protein [Microbacteriaceae bacterium]|nr:ATP-binding protein [Microbacteriaceae bacterium]
MSRRKIDSIIARSVAVFGLFLGVQATEAMSEQSARLSPLWSIVVTLLVYGGLVAGMITAALNRGTRVVFGYFTVAWLIGMASWPLAVSHAVPAVQDRPWLWYFCTVATATAAVAWPWWPALAALVVAPLCFGLVRVSPTGGGTSITAASFDVVDAWLLGAAILGIITMLRQRASALDVAQSAALGRYARAVRRQATEVQRSEVDGIVHDSVLSALLAASRAESAPSQKLAAEMAVDAIGLLRDAADFAPGDGQVVSLRVLVSRIEGASRSLGVPFGFQSEEFCDETVPTSAAEAVFSAALQAMSNSVAHARDTPPLRRWVSVRGRSDRPNGGGGILVEVGDTGRGFDPRSAPAMRIGLRMSVMERMLNAGGRGEIRSTLGVGTVISIVWPDDRRPSTLPVERADLGVVANLAGAAILPETMHRRAEKQ